MIYIKIKSDLYNDDNIGAIKRDYPFYYNRLRAVNRIIKKELSNTLKNYPFIDIYITTKNNKNLLGRFSKGILRHNEYRRATPDPYIILFWTGIEKYFAWHCVKGLKEVLYHEFIHFRQWLKSEKLGHYAGLKAKAEANNQNLRYLQKAIKRT